MAIPDPRVNNEGDSFEDLVKLLKGLAELSTVSEECSWLDGFAKIRAEPQMNSVAFETTVYQYSLAREKVTVSKEQAVLFKGIKSQHCHCPNELKNNCKIQKFGHCISTKKMRGYLIVGEEIPMSMLKNKFIICRSHRPFPYKIV